MENRANQAMSKRKRTDAKNTTVKTVKGIGHILKGNSQYASLLATGVFAAGVAAHKSGVDKILLDKGKQGVTAIISSNISALADAVMRGEYGNGADRVNALGSNYAAVQDEVNRRLYG